MHDYHSLEPASLLGDQKPGLPLPNTESYLRDGVSLHTACPKARLIEKGIQKPLSACIFWSIIAMGTAEEHYQVSGITGIQQKQQQSKAQSTVKEFRKRIWVEISL